MSHAGCYQYEVILQAMPTCHRVFSAAFDSAMLELGAWRGYTVHVGAGTKQEYERRQVGLPCERLMVRLVSGCT